MSNPSQESQLEKPWKKAQNGAIWCYLSEAPADVQALFPRPDANILPQAGSKVHHGTGFTLKIFDEGKTLKVYKWTPTKGGGGSKSYRTLPVAVLSMEAAAKMIESDSSLTWIGAVYVHNVGQIQHVVGRRLAA